MNEVSQRPAVDLGRDLHDVAILQANIVAKTQAISPEEMHVNVTCSAMSRVLEMMVLDILEAVAHCRVSAAEGFAPQRDAISFNHYTDQH